MEHWKQAFWITKFELKHYGKHLIIPLVLLALLLFLYVPTIPNLFIDSFGTDFLFLGLIIIIFTQWGRPKVFQGQKIGGGITASHFLVRLNQLPIAKEVIIKSRFLIYFILSIPYFSIFLLSLYALSSPLREKIPFSNYIVFLIIWLSYILFLGCTIPVSEAGGKVIRNVIIAILISPVIAAIYALLFTQLYKNGAVHWTMLIALEHPLLATVISLLLAFIGVKYWMNFMRKKMKKTDYI